MRKTFAAVLVSMAALSAPAAAWDLTGQMEEGSVLGAGAMMIESPYRGVDDTTYPVPVLIFEAKRFFVDKTVAGYYCNGPAEPLRWGVIGSLRLQGYEAGDSADLGGMRDRDMAFDAGLRILFKSKIVDTTLEAVTDVSGAHTGQEIRLGFSRVLFDGFLGLTAEVKWQSADLVRYYYGVDPGEARPGRGAYDPGDDLEYTAGATIGVPLGDRWAAFGDIQCVFLGDESADSPIAGDDAIMRYVVGAVYRF